MIIILFKIQLYLFYIKLIISFITKRILVVFNYQNKLGGHTLHFQVNRISYKQKKNQLFL